MPVSINTLSSSITSPIIAASLPYLSVLIAANTSSAFSAFTPIKTFPSLATSYGSIPNISDAALTASLTGMASS